jgi:hypothetical protein
MRPVGGMASAVNPTTSLPLSCGPTSGTARKAGRPVGAEVHCANAAAAAQTVAGAV